MNTKPIIFSGPMVRALLDGRKTQTRRVMKPQPEFDDDQLRGAAGKYWSFPKCPYGGGGDLLWVRETFGCPCHNSMQPVDGCELIYRATDEHDGDYPLSGWRPSIHMPRWASRLTLYLTDVRVERVQEVGYTAIKGEGALPANIVGGEKEFLADQYFRPLWDSINAKRGYPWADNPWVWAIYFRVIRANVDDVLAEPERYIQEAA